MLEYYRDLAQQLVVMPGGHTKLREAYFGGVTAPGGDVSSDKLIECWALAEGGLLALLDNRNNGTTLTWRRNDGEETIALFPEELQQAAREYAITHLGLALLVLAMGGIDDSRLKKLLPKLHKASKGLLLIAVCRLCG